MQKSRYGLKAIIGISLPLAIIIFNPITLGRLFTADGVISNISLRILLWFFTAFLSILLFWFIKNPEGAIEYFFLNYRNYFLLILATILTLVLSEFALRTKLAKYRSIYASSLEFDYVVRKNSHGFRDDEFTKNKDKNTFRIFLIGDSFVEGVVKEGETFDKLLERKCKENGLNCQAYNLGMGGTKPSVQLLAAKEFKDFKPDLVIFSLYVDSGIEVSDEQANQVKPQNFYKRMIRALNSLEVLKLSDYFLNSFSKKNIYPWLQRYEGNDFYKKLMLQQQMNPWLFLRTENVDSLGGNQKYYDDTLIGRFNGDPAIKKIILGMKGTFHNAPFLLLLLPSKYQVNSKYFDILRRIGLPCRDIKIVDRRLQDTIISWALKNHIDYLDVLPAMRRGPNKSFFYDIDIHFNVQGNYLVIGELYKKLNEMGMLKSIK